MKYLAASLSVALVLAVTSPAQAADRSVEDTAFVMKQLQLLLEQMIALQTLIENQESNLSTTMNTAIIKTNHGDITLELFNEEMPITVGNFVTLTEDGFYNETKFHRVIDGFMIQGGDPNTKEADESMWGRGGPGYNIEDEFVAHDHYSNTRGTISMANTGHPNSGGSQWFINLVDNTTLDFDKVPLSSKHPVFGRVTDGMDVVDTIAQLETDAMDRPLEPVVIESIVVSTSK